MKTQISALMLALLSVGMVGCNDNNDPIPVKEEVVEATPTTISLERLGNTMHKFLVRVLRKFLLMMLKANVYL